MADEYQKRELTSGLVGGKYNSLYQGNPYFKVAIDTLAKTLPVWVDGLAVQAIKDYNAAQEDLGNKKRQIQDYELPEQREDNGEND